MNKQDGDSFDYMDRLTTKNELSKRIGNGLKAYRKETERTVSDLAFLLDCSESTIRRHERGVYVPAMKRLWDYVRKADLPLMFLSKTPYKESKDDCFFEFMDGLPEDKAMLIFLKTRMIVADRMDLYDKERLDRLISFYDEEVPDYLDIGYSIYLERELKGYSRLEISKQVSRRESIQEKTLQNIEMGDAQVSFQKINWIAECMNIPLEVLFVGMLAPDKRMHVLLYYWQEIFDRVSDGTKKTRKQILMGLRDSR